MRCAGSTTTYQTQTGDKVADQTLVCMKSEWCELQSCQCTLSDDKNQKYHILSYCTPRQFCDIPPSLERWCLFFAESLCPGSHARAVCRGGLTRSASRLRSLNQVLPGAMHACRSHGYACSPPPHEHGNLRLVIWRVQFVRGCVAYTNRVRFYCSST